MVNLANLITFARIALIPFFAIALYKSRMLAAIVFAVIALTDFLDGYVARKRNEATKFGGFMDHFADKLLVSAALILLVGKGVDLWIAVVIIAREVLVLAMRLSAGKRAEKIKVSRLGKSKTFLQMVSVFAVLLELPFAWWLLLIATLLTLFSGLDYAAKLLSKNKK